MAIFSTIPELSERSFLSRGTAMSEFRVAHCVRAKTSGAEGMFPDARSGVHIGCAGKRNLA